MARAVEEAADWVAAVRATRAVQAFEAAADWANRTVQAAKAAACTAADSQIVQAAEAAACTAADFQIVQIIRQYFPRPPKLRRKYRGSGQVKKN
jgi:hypothetical protein